MSHLEELLPEFRKGAKIRKRYWEKEHYLYYDCEDIWNEDDELVSFSGEDLVCDSWEFYKEPIDWDYIIKNKCLCWFWYEGEEERKIAGYLADYDSYNSQFGRYRGKNVAVTYFDHCRPVRRDEVPFYEDKE